MQIEGAMDDAQHNYDQLKLEHGIADADMDAWQRQPQSGASQI